MDPFFMRTLSNWVALFGAFLGLLGLAGKWYYGEQADQISPYVELIHTAEATVDVSIESNTSTTMGLSAGYLTLLHDKRPLLTTEASSYTSEQTVPNTVRYHATFQMTTDDPAVGQKVGSLRRADTAEISFDTPQFAGRVLTSSAILTINGKTHLPIKIPEQTIQNRIIAVRNPLAFMPEIP